MSKFSIDIEKCTLPQDFNNMSGAKKLLTKIPVRKPNKTEFFRVLGDGDYSFQAAIIELKEENETYLVSPELCEKLFDFITPVQVVLAITRVETLLVWPVKLPQKRRNAWHDTALLAMELAKNKWICMRANMDVGYYDILEATGKLPDPKWPIDTLSFNEIINLAFKDYYIDSLEHPLIRRLTGES